jgi:lipopolysaccharide export system permease protein
VFWNILHRMIFWELMRVFLLSLLGITGILLMATIVAEASRHGLGPLQILGIIPLLIPSTLPYTIPATTLFATCVVYGRLAHDNEILAIRAAGVNILVVVWPVALLGVLMAGLTVGLYYSVIPTTHHLMRSMLLNDVEELLYTMLRQDGNLKYPKMNYEMYVKRVLGRKLIDAEFKRREKPDPKRKDKEGQSYDVVARAREAELRVHMQKKQVLVHMRHCYITSTDPGIATGLVEDKVWPVDLPPEIDEEKDRKHRASDMTWDELHAAYADRTRGLEETDAEIALVTTRLSLSKPIDDLPKHLGNLRARRIQLRNEQLGFAVELQMRPALSLGCLCFVLVGCPVGIWLSRSDYLSAFITCFLPIVFVYYPLMLCGLNLAKGSRIPAVVSIWGADLLMALVAAGLFKRLLRN